MLPMYGQMHESLAHLSNACTDTSIGPVGEATDDTSFAPPVVDSIEETGISQSIIEHLILKYLHFRGELSGRQIANMMGLQFSVISELLENSNISS